MFFELYDNPLVSVIEHLPNELRERFTEMREMDLAVQSKFPPSWARFVEQKLALSSSFRCDQIRNRNRYDFGPTLLSYLSRTWKFNKHTYE
jgi:hypothetical protein